MNTLHYFATVYDFLHDRWEAKPTQKIIALFLIFIFVISILLVELNGLGVLPEAVTVFIPLNHLAPVTLVFSVILFLEIIALLFTTAYSISKTLCMQLEILALILLRNAFKVVAAVNDVEKLAIPHLTEIIVSSTTGIILFICAVIGRRLIIQLTDILPDEHQKLLYLYVRKTIAIFLLIGFIILCIEKFYTLYVIHAPEHFFESVYSMLIIFDILILLISQYFIPSAFYMFRNSAFVLCTLFVRMALTADTYTMSALGLIAGVYTLFISWITRTMIQKKLVE